MCENLTQPASLPYLSLFVLALLREAASNQHWGYASDFARDFLFVCLQVCFGLYGQLEERSYSGK